MLTTESFQLSIQVARLDDGFPAAECAAKISRAVGTFAAIIRPKLLAIRIANSIVAGQWLRNLVNNDFPGKSTSCMKAETFGLWWCHPASRA